MKPIDPLSVDFAALRVLRMVHAHQSFSRAADALGVTQSTISYAIDRLRRAFSDPLFVRQGGGIVTTDRCEEIVEAAARMVDEFAALTEPRVFDPASAQATIILSCNFYERVTLVPPLVRLLRDVAPMLKLNIISSTVQGKIQLNRGEADLLIGPIQLEDGGFFGRRLLRDHYVCVMARDNPLAGQPLEAERFVAAPHAVVTYGGNWRSRYLVEIEAQGHVLNTLLEVPSPANLPDILIGTDLISTVPLRTAQTFGPEIIHCDCPFPAPFNIDLYWTSRTHHSAMHKWLRGVIGQIAETLHHETPLKT
ncbi:LysR family transcriptional regulator [Thalassovita taeanensis]|uniref:DNA-binding transcriptional regulator, LysR family n=1 Tax=Thalassovita taeanensis TaxID=657014 RepID=A0A1H9A6F3_9RHOB|nr:LysR family transcriptional regulator [Thalassovita taeanensis]SEP72316.1 DNA-binding transcriptional regulator, LysR family [Thalassovita taeanensis]